MNPLEPIITVTLNAAIDRVMEVENFHVGGHLRGRLLARVPAGKGVNVSRTLAHAGIPSVATGFVGRDQLDDFDRSFADLAVQSQFLGLDGDTRENVTLIDPAGGVETHIRDVGPTPTPKDLERLRNKLNLLAKPDGLIVFSGSVPSGVDAGAVVDLVDLALSKGAKVAVDGPGALLHALDDRKLWLVKPNVDELAAMLSGTVTDQAGTATEASVPDGDASTAPSCACASAAGAGVDHADALSDDRIVAIGRELSRRIHVVIVTCGSAGGYLFIDGSALMGQVAMESKNVVSTVGCGDAMLAAFVAAQSKGKDVKASYEYALAVASAAALHNTPGVFDPAVAKKLLAKASVTAIK